MTISVKNAAGTNVTISTIDDLLAVVATGAKQDNLIASVDGVEASLASILAKIIAAPATEAKQDTEIAAVNRVGTRAYGTVTRIASGATTTLSAPISATEVLVHATGKQYILPVAGTGSPTIDATSAIPMEAGEKFHLRITSGQRIATIRDTADGFLHIAPVV